MTQKMQKANLKQQLQVLATLKLKMDEAGAKPDASKEYAFGAMQIEGLKMIVEDERAGRNMFGKIGELVEYEDDL